MSPSAMTLDFDILAFCNDIQSRDLPLSQTRFFARPRIRYFARPRLSDWVLLEAIDLGFEIVLKISSLSGNYSWIWHLPSFFRFSLPFLFGLYTENKCLLHRDRNFELGFIKFCSAKEPRLARSRSTCSLVGMTRLLQRRKDATRCNSARFDLIVSLIVGIYNVVHECKPADIPFTSRIWLSAFLLRYVLQESLARAAALLQGD